MESSCQGFAMLSTWMVSSTYSRRVGALSQPLIEVVSRKTHDRNSQRLPREFWIGASLGYLTSRSQASREQEFEPAPGTHRPR